MFWKRIGQIGAERRTNVRALLTVSAWVRLTSGKRMAVSIRDLSTTGFKALIPSEVEPDALLQVSLGISRSPYATVVWKDGGWTGCKFLKPLAKADVAAAMSGSA